MDSSIHEKRLQKTLRLRQGSPNILNNRENTTLELKLSFGFGSLARYARTMASFANNRGGFIVYGVEPRPHVVRGIQQQKFAEIEPARITQFLNDYISPELQWELGTISFHGRTLGYLFTHESTDKPIVAVRSSKSDLKEGNIYYRYRGQSSTIRFPELRAIIDSRIERERRAWMEALNAITRVGPTNIGVLDTVHGKLYGSGAQFLIDEALLREIKFVKKGNLSEAEGSPTLRVVGEVKPVYGAEIERPVRVGIYEEDIFTAFLAARPLDAGEARSYLRATAYLISAYSPIHYFARLADLTVEEAATIIKEARSPFKKTQSQLVKRIMGQTRIPRCGVVDPDPPRIGSITKDGLKKRLSSARLAADKRTLLLAVIQKAPELIASALSGLPLLRILEAVTHVSHRTLASKREAILEVLLRAYSDQATAMSSSERTAFRKAVAYCDEVLFGGRPKERHEDT